jgi:hypothetical protein
MRHYRNPLAAIVTTLALGAALTGCGTTPTALSSSSLTSFNGLSASANAILDAAGKPNTNKPPRKIDFVTIQGTVTQLLPDDTKGTTHQLFRLKAMVKGQMQTVQCAHNTDLAPYVPLKVGDEVEIKGEFIKETPYDIIHWTHYNPRGGDGGYISHKGKKYEKL